MTFIHTMWLGYFNLVLNLFIYTIFNHLFCKALKKILCLTVALANLSAYYVEDLNHGARGRYFEQ